MLKQKVTSWLICAIMLLASAPSKAFAQTIAQHAPGSLSTQAFAQNKPKLPPQVNQGSSVSEIVDWLDKNSFSQARIGLESEGSESYSDPADTTESINREEAKRSLVTDRDADTYKLVFPTGPGTDEFFAQLNKAGEQGYKLLSVMYRWHRLSTLDGYRTPVAILKLDSVPHEYIWFKVKARDYFFSIPGFDEKYKEQSDQGFQLVDFLADVYCGDTDLEGNCNSAADYLFLLERQKGVEKPLKFIVARSVPKRKLRMGPELTEQIKAKLADGLYPISVFNKFEILLTQMNRDELSTGNPDVQVVTNSFPHDVKGKIKDLAKQGYRILIVSSGSAVMYRRADSRPPVSYKWLDADNSDFEKQLLELQTRGAVYRMIYPNRDRTTKEGMIFELGAADGGRRREYKVLRFEFQDGKDAAGNPVPSDLTPSSKETLKLMNSLAKEGFVVRELFKSKKVSVLLERSR